MSIEVSVADVHAAARRIRDGVVRSEATLSESLSSRSGCQLYLKHENRQRSGSFKERGARNALLCLDKEQQQRGVIAASAGNHALALARHGRLMEIPVTVVMPKSAPLVKVERCRYYGATVVQYGDHLLEGKVRALELAEEDGLRYINGYDDPEIIAGAGTIGLELLEEIPDLDVVVVPVGGGGLLAGISVAIKALKPSVRVIGVETDRVASMRAALDQGQPVSVEMRPSLADGLAVSQVGGNAFSLLQKHMDDLIVIDEEDVALAILRLTEIEKTVVEGAGAVGLAALLAKKVPEVEGKNVATPLCGGNIDTSVLGRILQRGLAVDGRVCRFRCTISDRPGGLAGLSGILSRGGASIVEIAHDRVFCHSRLDSVTVVCTVETKNHEHINELTDAMATAGYEVEVQRPMD